MLAREPHRGDHVGDAPTSSDQRGLARDLTVPDRSRLGVARLATLDDVTEQAGSELFGRRRSRVQLSWQISSSLRPGCAKTRPEPSTNSRREPDDRDTVAGPRSPVNVARGDGREPIDRHRPVMTAVTAEAPRWNDAGMPSGPLDDLADSLVDPAVGLVRVWLDRAASAPSRVRATRQRAPASADERPVVGRLHHGVCGSRLAAGVGDCRGGATPQDRRRSAPVVSLPGRPCAAARRCRVLATVAGAGDAARSPAAAPDRGCARRGSRRRRAARLSRPPRRPRALRSTRTCSVNPCSATPRPRRRLEATIALLQRDDVDYVSVKASSVASQLNLWAYDHTLERVKASLRPLFASAAAAVAPEVRQPRHGGVQGPAADDRRVHAAPRRAGVRCARGRHRAPGVPPGFVRRLARAARVGRGTGANVVVRPSGCAS